MLKREFRRATICRSHGLSFARIGAGKFPRGNFASDGEFAKEKCAALNDFCGLVVAVAVAENCCFAVAVRDAKNAAGFEVYCNDAAAIGERTVGAAMLDVD